MKVFELVRELAQFEPGAEVSFRCGRYVPIVSGGAEVCRDVTQLYLKEITCGFSGEPKLCLGILDEDRRCPG